MPGQWEYQLPTRIQFGKGSIGNLGSAAKEFGTKALLVGYRDRTGMEKIYDRAAKLLADAGVAVTEFFEIPPDPDAELGLRGAELAKQAGVDVVIGLGGGSAIDAAKGIAIIAKMGGGLWDYTGANPDFKPATDALPIIAVPTTAGTGTEVTAVAVFTHHGVGAMPEFDVKASVSGQVVRPKIAIVDPDLTVGAPSRLTACCGADALGHAIEACMSRKANPITNDLAARAVALIVKHLPDAVENPNDPEPREPIALGSTMAGTAFGVAGVVMTHSIAQALGGILHIQHGEAVAIGTPLNLRYNAPKCVDVYARLAHYCGIMADSKQEQADRFVEYIEELFEKIGLPRRITVPDDAPDDLAAVLARNAFASTPVPLKLNPRKIDEATLAELLKEIL